MVSCINDWKNTAEEVQKLLSNIQPCKILIVLADDLAQCLSKFSVNPSQMVSFRRLQKKAEVTTIFKKRNTHLPDKKLCYGREIA